ncbi:CRIB domain-containing protein RIC10-like [Miscanthus floridulus]|uniref:CRIB domain-containing protein RIC10-like n=1 Tax=Miscanthus floridulus TaxID=154761 RepID=UPI00345B0423
MAIAMKGIFRGLKIIAQIFTVQREHEIEIGYPTDVRHVSHVGLGASDSCPSWMNEFRGGEEVTAGGRGASIVSSAAQSRHTSWACLDFEQPATGAAPPTEACADSRSGQDGAARGGGPVTAKKAARPRRASRAASPGGSSSWRSTASFATACDGHSCELHVPAGLQAA